MKKVRPIKAEYMTVLKRIQDSIPKDWLDNVVKKEVLAPKNAQLMRDLAAGRDNPDVDMSKITDKQREFAKALVDSGNIKELEKEIDVEDKEVAKKIEEYIYEEIKKAVARGELPKGKKFRNLNKKISWKKQSKN